MLRLLGLPIDGDEGDATRAAASPSVPGLLPPGDGRAVAPVSVVEGRAWG
jgi:hypothetical protein